MQQFNKTTNSTYLQPNHVSTLRAQKPQEFAKFGANMDSDGIDTLWISSGWANDEAGVVWSYNITTASPKPKHQWQHQLQRIFKSEDDNFCIAQIFAQGQESKVFLRR
jgi:hypothetical protein